jgi:hypothetical protein
MKYKVGDSVHLKENIAGLYRQENLIILDVDEENKKYKISKSPTFGSIWLDEKYVK